MCRQTVAGGQRSHFSLRRADRKQLHRQRTVNDKAGNPGSASHNLAVDTPRRFSSLTPSRAMISSTTPTRPGAGDLRYQHGRGSGRCGSVVLNGKTYTTTLDASGNWRSAYRRRMLRRWVAAHRPSPQRQRSGRQQRRRQPHRDRQPSAPVISINTIAGDDVINATEKDLIWRFLAPAISLRVRRSRHPERTKLQRHHGCLRQLECTVPASAVSALGEATYSVTARSPMLRVTAAPPAITCRLIPPAGHHH